MPGELKNIFKVAGTYTATIIGAGFASGQEVVSFFSVYYEGGFYGIVLAGFLFAAIGCIVLDRVYNDGITSYEDFLLPAMGSFMGWIIDIISTLFMFFVFSTMAIGSGNLLSAKTGIPLKHGMAISCIICIGLILTNIKGIVALSSIVAPILVAGIIIVGSAAMTQKGILVFNFMDYARNITHNWFFSALVYVSYNSLLAVAVMCSLLPYLKTRKVGIAGGILGGMILCISALFINYLIYSFSPDSLSIELPLLGMAEKYSEFMGWFYSLILWLAMLISAVTSGHCFVERVSSKVKMDRMLLTPITCILAVPFAGMGFSSLIANIYPVFGYAGLFMVFVIILNGIKSAL